MSFKMPHIDDLATNAKLPGMLAENARAVEQELNEIDKNIARLTKQYNELNKDDIQTELINDAGISVTNSDGETSIIDISDTDTSSEIS